MTRKETTDWLGELLVRRILNKVTQGCWASEVRIDYGTSDVRRVDFLLFEPEQAMGGVSGIEKGSFTCFEVKSCMADFNSGYGRNRIGERNYFVLTMDTYKKIPKGSAAPQELMDMGFYIACPIHRKLEDEFENPTEPSGKIDNWTLKKLDSGRPPMIRKKSITELLYCMLKAGQ